RKNLQLQRQARETAELNQALQLQRKHDLQHIAERQQVEAALRQSREELRMLANYQERVKEDERKRIAREIHDDLGQNLLALRIDISMLYARSSKIYPKLNAKIQSVLDQIDVTIKSMRDIINNLRPTVLDLGLDAAIQWQVDEFRRRSGIACELRMDEHEFALSDDRATAVFRILQESLCNIIRHACATHVEVDLHKDEHMLFMRVADNGVGSYPGCRRKSNSFGLVGMRERISALGGELIIDTALDKGMTLLISIPLEHDDTGTAYEAELESSDGVSAASIVAVAKSTLDLQYGKNTPP
ncbi:MAG TPA: sensor histidine kinase, partial [Burkholderiaceae bacterium]|nr:sensor histidine kinase [Burkholderiaceae bacterium]